MMERVCIFFLGRYDHEKIQELQKNLVSMLIHGDLNFRVKREKGNKYGKKNCTSLNESIGKVESLVPTLRSSWLYT